MRYVVSLAVGVGFVVMALAPDLAMAKPIDRLVLASTGFAICALTLVKRVFAPMPVQAKE